MSNTSLPQQAPMTNGTHTKVNGEADVSVPSSTHPATQRSLQDVCALLHDQVSSFLAAKATDDVTRRTQEQTRISMQVIETALNDYEFGSLSLSYNGGKDCLVLLILYLAVLHVHFSPPKNGVPSPKPHKFPTEIPSIYAKSPDPFPAVSEFVDYSSALYHLDLTHIFTNPGSKKKENIQSIPPPAAISPETNGLSPTASSTDPPIVSFRDAFALYLSTQPSVRAIFVGTRRTDPHGSHLTHFDPTDHNWPDFMRIHPVIDWNLSEIWCFLRSPCLTDLGVSCTEANGEQKAEQGSCGAGPLRYCEMYDQGYTSLGGVNDTVRNPGLRYVDGDGRERFKPAYEMTWDEGERLGRE